MLAYKLTLVKLTAPFPFYYRDMQKQSNISLGHSLLNYLNSVEGIALLAQSVLCHSLLLKETLLLCLACLRYCTLSIPGNYWRYQMEIDFKHDETEMRQDRFSEMERLVA